MTIIKMIDLFSNSLGEEELQAIRPVFESRWIATGKETKQFERELSDRFGRSTLVTDSCTSALYMSMKILDIGKGDEVIIPSIHFIGAINAIIDSGARPVFADVDLKYLNIIPEEIGRLRNQNTKAVMLLHYGGHPCDMDEIYKYSEGLKIIEDSANSPFSEYKGKNCGTLGDIGCFSFDAMKILCMGNGGAICVRDELYDKAREYRYLGIKDSQSGLDSVKEKKRWWELELSCTSNRNTGCDILSAIGRVQLRKVDWFIERRKEIWSRYQEELSGLDWLETPPEPLPRTKGSYYFYWIKVEERDQLAQYLVDNGIYCSFKYPPLHLIDYYHSLLFGMSPSYPYLSDLSKAKHPNSELLNERVLNIPLHQNLSDDDVAKIIRTIKKFGLEERV